MDLTGGRLSSELHNPTTEMPPWSGVRQVASAHVPEKHVLAKARVDAGFPKKLAPAEAGGTCANER